MFADYDELKAGIADFLNRDDLTAVIPSFIRLAESRIDRDLRHWKQERRTEVTVDAQYNDVLPSDFLRPIRLQLLSGSTGELSPMSTAQMLQRRGDSSDLPGRPTAYGLTAGDLEVFPTPSEAQDVSLLYYGRIAALSASNSVNWLLTEAPDVYLYGALVHTAPYLKDDARIQIWEALFKLGLDTLNRTSDDAKYGGSGLKMRTRRGAP